MKRIVLMLTVGVLLASVMPAMPVIAFNTLSPQTVSTGGGQITYAGGATPLIGTNIVVSDISLGGTSVAACQGCVLNFTTGNRTGLIVDAAGNRTWTFFSGPATLGGFTITGQVNAAGINTNQTLLTGFFTAPTLSVTGAIGTLPRYRFFSGALYDAKNAVLVDYLLGAGFAATNGTRFTGNYVQDFVDNRTFPQQIPILSDTLLDGTITNDTSTPEPSAIVLSNLVGLALVGGLYLRRRKAASTTASQA